MTRIVSAALHWVMRQAVLLLAILAVLLAMAWVDGELKRAGELAADRAGLATRKSALASELDALKRDASERTRQAAALGRTHASMLERKRAERQALWERHPWARKNPLSEVALTIRLLDAEIATYEGTVGRLAQARGQAIKELDAQIARNERALELLDAQIAGIDDKLGRSTVARFAAVARQELPTALAILLAIILLPIGIKAFLYFVVAPLAQRRPPLRLLPSAAGRVGAGSASAVSIPLVLKEDEELLVHAGYLQSSPLHAQKSTKWLLDPRLPLSSLFSGMFMLTRIHSSAEPIVVSATRDPLGEVGIVELEEGAAFACQPRALAGVVQQRANPIRITRHWRFGLQGWLTLQLRFLVFHGPGRLIMKGCRGVRVERASAARLINQAATLGFSANLAYANTRSETFASYWAGKDELFNDLFEGDGVYVYEEMPGAARAGGAGGYLRGFSDALLKVFGV